jgi:hypothetical protein
MVQADFLLHARDLSEVSRRGIEVDALGGHKLRSNERKREERYLKLALRVTFFSFLNARISGRCPSEKSQNIKSTELTSFKRVCIIKEKLRNIY